MKCPWCGYEDITFSLPANLDCPACGYKYRYKGKELKKNGSKN